jgi:hypothetical protein
VSWPPPEGLAEYLAGTAFDTVTLLTAAELTPDERAGLPDWVLDAATTEGSAGIKAATAYWRQVLEPAFSTRRSRSSATVPLPRAWAVSPNNGAGASS